MNSSIEPIFQYSIVVRFNPSGTFKKRVYLLWYLECSSLTFETDKIIIFETHPS